MTPDARKTDVQVNELSSYFPILIGTTHLHNKEQKAERVPIFIGINSATGDAQ
jgi:hypothetical protein